MVTLQLDSKEARLVRAALEQEIKSGCGTFLTARDVEQLAKIAALLESKELV